MNIPFVFRSLGIVMLFAAAAMLPSALIALLNHEKDIWAFITSIFIMVVSGLIMYRSKIVSNDIGYKEKDLLSPPPDVCSIFANVHSLVY